MGRARSVRTSKSTSESGPASPLAADPKRTSFLTCGNRFLSSRLSSRIAWRSSKLSSTLSSVRFMAHSPLHKTYARTTRMIIPLAHLLSHRTSMVVSSSSHPASAYGPRHVSMSRCASHLGGSRSQINAHFLRWRVNARCRFDRPGHRLLRTPPLARHATR